MPRERNSNANINWQQVAFGIGKNRRKTVGFGQYNKRERKYEDEFYIRELSIVNGGIGCALWDAAIILCRFFYEHGEDLLRNESVLELGAGVGLPGVCAARFAKRVVLTDYIESVVDNLKYNLMLNGKATYEDILCEYPEISEYIQQSTLSCETMPTPAVIGYAKTELEFGTESNNSGDDDMSISSGCIEKLENIAPDFGLCENLNLQSETITRDISSVDTSNLVSDMALSNYSSGNEMEDESSCASAITPPLPESLQCIKKRLDQIKNIENVATCQMLDWYEIDNLNIQDTYDVVIGSELTYTEASHTIQSLCKVIDRFTSQNGIFLEILSDDRDGVSSFFNVIVDQYHYVYSIHHAPEKYIGNFGTGQNPETYKLYLFAREVNDKFRAFQSRLGTIYKTNT